MPTLPVSESANSALSTMIPISTIAVKKRWFTFRRSRFFSLAVLGACLGECTQSVSQQAGLLCSIPHSRAFKMFAVPRT